MEVITKSAQETMAWARQFAKNLKAGDVICLHGDLGAGKTTFVKGLAEGLGLAKSEHVTSPTFVIMHRYDCRMPLYHFDCYRIESPEELVAVGFEDFVNAGGGVACVEWPEKAGNLIPAGKIDIYLEHQGSDSRRIRVKNK